MCSDVVVDFAETVLDYASPVQWCGMRQQVYFNDGGFGACRADVS
jgi:hypothetical protein